MAGQNPSGVDKFHFSGGVHIEKHILFPVWCDNVQYLFYLFFPYTVHIQWKVKVIPVIFVQSQQDSL